MVYKAVIFDLDGTLVHTTQEYRSRTCGQTLATLGVKAKIEQIDKFWFGTDRDRIITETFGLNPKVFWRIFREYDNIESRKKFTKPYDDIDFIRELRAKGIKTGIVTGAPPNIATMEIELLGKQDFDAIVIAHTSNGKQPKPHPQGLVECLNLLDVNNNGAIYVGNGEEDIVTARNAGVLDILIDRGEFPFNDLNASLKINSLYDLRKVLSSV
ncbi:MAG: HAD-IA family hydrolase [Nanoarchaeota archaeon]